MSLLILWQHGLWGIQGSPCIARDAVCCWCSLCLRHFGQGHNMRRSNDSAHSSDVYTQHCVKVKCCRYRKQEVPFPQNWFSTLIPNGLRPSGNGWMMLDAPLSIWPNWCPSLLTAKDPAFLIRQKTLCQPSMSTPNGTWWPMDANGTGCNWMQLMFYRNLRWKLSIEKVFSKSLATSRLLWNSESPTVGSASSSDQLGSDVMRQTRGPNNAHGFWRPMTIAAVCQICESGKQIVSWCF